MISYLTPGAPRTAATWNALFAPLDEKISAAMAGRNLLFFDNAEHGGVLIDMNLGIAESGPHVVEADGVAGWVFLFAGAGARWITGGIHHVGIPRPAYDHSVFEAVVAAQPVVALNEDFKLVTLDIPSGQHAEVGLYALANDDFFSVSLEAHRKAYTPPGGEEFNYWVMQETPNPLIDDAIRYPNRTFGWSQAEIAIDAEYGATLEMLAKYNKFNFFRFHNCQAEAVTVTFKSTLGATVHTLIVPAFGSQCVRRTGVDGTYTNGYQYLQKMLPGDYRFMNFGEIVGPNWPMESWRQGVTNNAVNPMMLYKYLKLFRDRGQNAPVADRAGGMYEDPNEVWDARSLYAATYGTYDETSMVGQLRHHRGSLLHIIQDPATPDVIETKEIQFNGLSSAVADFALGDLTFTFADLDAGSARGFRITAASDGKNHWLMPVSTNVLGPYIAVVDGSMFITTMGQVNANQIYRLPMVSGALPRYFVLPSPYSDDVNLGGQNLPRRQVLIDDTAVSRSLVWTGGTVNRTEAVIGFSGDGIYADLMEDSTSFADLLDHLLDDSDWGEWGPDATGFPLTGFGPVITARMRLYDKVPPNTPFGNTLVRGRYDAIDLPTAIFLSFEDGLITWRERLGLRAEYTWPVAYNPWFLNARNTRRYQDLMDGGSTAVPLTGTLKASGFPAWPFGDLRLAHEAQSNELSVDGSEFTVGRLTSLRTDIAIQMLCGPGVAPINYSYTKIPMLGVPDPLQGALEHKDEAGWWEDNHERLEGGELGFEDGIMDYGGSIGLVSTRFIRFVLSVEYYNNLAALVNAMKWAKPLNFNQFRIQLADDSWQALRANQTGPYGTCRPRTQYAGALTAEDVEFCAIAEAAGFDLPVRSITDLPGWSTVLGTPRKLLAGEIDAGPYALTLVSSVFDNNSSGDPNWWFYHDTYTFTPIMNWTVADGSAYTATELRGAFSRIVPGLTTNTTVFAWCEIAKVQAFAESIGYPFSFEDFGVPLALVVVEYADPPGDAEEITAETGAFGINRDYFDAVTLTEYAFDLADFTHEHGEFPNPPAYWLPDHPEWSTLALIPDRAEGEWMTNDFSSFTIADQPAASDMAATKRRDRLVAAGVPYADLGAPVTDEPGTDTTTITISYTVYWGFEFAGDTLRTYVDGSPFLNATRPDLVPGLTSVVGQYAGPALLFRSYGSPGSRALLVPVSWFDYSSLGYSDIVAMVDTGVTVFPLRSNVPASEALDSIALADGATIVDVDDVAAAARVMHYVDGMVGL